MEIRQITSVTAIRFLLPRHYSGRTPQITIAYGWYDSKELKAVCTFGKPANNYLCEGACGKENSRHVYELNRLCRTEDLVEPLSKFVAECLRELKKNNWIIVSYADSGMNHCGYIYQATNFIYTGKTKERTDKYTESNKHSRHPSNIKSKRKVRTAKHRYIYFCTNDKKLKKEWIKQLRYKVEPYPKEQNKNYILGEYHQQTVIETNMEDTKKLQLDLF